LKTRQLFAQNIRKQAIILLPAVAALAAVCLVAKPAASQESKDSNRHANGHHSIGFIASDEAGAKEVGLPIYPGARPHKDKSDDTPATQLGLWGGNSGFKLVVLKMESKDAPDKVAAFYRKALGKYGKVLSCPDPSGSSGTAKSSDGNKSKDLDCDDNPKPGEVEFKAGTEEYQHIVAIEPNGAGSVFSLLYVEAKRSDGDKEPI
jgi:hypothetical protein